MCRLRSSKDDRSLETKVQSMSQSRPSQGTSATSEKAGEAQEEKSSDGGAIHAYLTSDLWASIRAKILLDGAECACGCNRPADQVHHKIYTEANLLGTTLDGLVPLFHECHHEIEFSGKRKVTLAEANFELKRRQLQGLPEIEAPTDDEVKSFLSGKHAHLSERRKEIVSRYLYG